METAADNKVDTINFCTKLKQPESSATPQEDEHKGLRRKKANTNRKTKKNKCDGCVKSSTERIMLSQLRFLEKTKQQKYQKKKTNGNQCVIEKVRHVAKWLTAHLDVCVSG